MKSAPLRLGNNVPPCFVRLTQADGPRSASLTAALGLFSPSSRTGKPQIDIRGNISFNPIALATEQHSVLPQGREGNWHVIGKPVITSYSDMPRDPKAPPNELESERSQFSISAAISSETGDRRSREQVT